MADRYEMVWAKVEHADDLIEQLRNKITEYHDANPASGSVEVVERDELLVTRVARDPAPIPRSVPLLIGDIAHNLRTALDYFAYAVVSSQTKDTAFPIWRAGGRASKNDIKGLIGGKLKSAPAPLLAHMRDFEPFEGGKDELIWGLDSLDVTDKHHLPVVAFYSYQAFTFDAGAFLRKPDAGPGEEWLRDIPVEPIALRPADAVERIAIGSELFIAPRDFYETQGEAFKVTFDIALDSPAPYRGRRVVDTLRAMSVEVTRLLQEDLIPLGPSPWLAQGGLPCSAFRERSPACRRLP